MLQSHFVVVIKPALLTGEEAREGIRIHGIRVFRPAHLSAVKNLARYGALGRVSKHRIYLRPVVNGEAKVNSDFPLFSTFGGRRGPGVTNAVFSYLNLLGH